MNKLLPDKKETVENKTEIEAMKAKSFQSIMDNQSLKMLVGLYLQMHI